MSDYNHVQALSWPSIGFYCLFAIFVFYQQLHAKHFRGSSQGFRSVLSLSAFLGMLTGFGYLIYYGWHVVWWAPFLIFLISLCATLIGAAVEKLVGPLVLSLAGFVGWPVCAYFMFSFVPNAS